MKSVFINLHGDTNITAAYLHSLIDKAGFDISTIHFRRLGYEIEIPNEKELSTLKKLVNKLNPEVILMSVNSMSFWTAVKISELFKDKIVVWGGVQPMIDPERCLDYAKIIIRGEGDEATIELLAAIRDKNKIDNIKNVWTNKNGKIIKNDFRPLLSNLDNLPLPDFTESKKFYVLGDKIYRHNPFPHQKYEYNISFSRGCPFNCKYCLNHFLNKTFKYKYLRRRSVDSVIKELIQAKKTFPKLSNINFWDDVFLSDSSWLKEFVVKYKKYINLPFFAYGNAQFVTDENALLLKQAGISFFDLGLQTGSENIRKNYFGRSDTNEQILAADKIIHKYNIPVGYDLIFSEFETEKDLEKGIDFMLKLKKPFKVQRNKLAYYPNFEVTDLALEKKLIAKEDIASFSNKVKSQIMNNSSVEKNPLMIYYYLFGKILIPNYLIKHAFAQKWHLKHRKILGFVVAFIDKFEGVKSSFKSMFVMLLRGEIRYVLNRLFDKKKFSA